MAMVAVQFVDPIPQDLTFHAFAETGHWLGLPNFWNVVTNAALVIAGGIGLHQLSRRDAGPTATSEKCFHLGLVLTGFGSAFYHYAPTNTTLVWDRLPMTVAFMALFIALLGHCFEGVRTQRALPLALVAGVASVIYWAYTESLGAGDLRYYVIVQFLPMVLTPLLLLRWPPRGMRVAWLWAMLSLYVAAKSCELLDHEMAKFLPWSLSGHAIKHLFAGAAGLAFIKSHTSAGAA